MKSLKKVVLALVLSLAVSGVAFADFNDVPQDHPNYEAIQHLEMTGAIDKNDNFYPDRMIQKAEFYKMMFNSVGYDPVVSQHPTRFQDVPRDAWFAPFVERAFELHFLQFNPDDPYFYPIEGVTRIEALRVGLALYGVPAPQVVNKGDLKCTDLPFDRPFAYLFVGAERLDLFADLQDGFCSPAVRLTRADMAELIYRLYLRSGDAAYEPTRDVAPAQRDESVGVRSGEEEISITFGDDKELADNVEELLNNEKFKIFLNVWSKVQDDYVFKDEVDDDELVYGAINGLVDRLEDPYSEFQEPKEAQQFTESLNGNFQGIGASVDIIEGEFTIVAPIKGSPAERAGLKPNDVVLKVDGEDIAGLALEQGIDLIKGPEGTTVVLTIDRDGQVFDVSIVRAVIDLPFIESELKDSGVAYIRIGTFAEDTDERFLEEMKKVEESEPTGLVIDLRSNPGGFLDATVEILNHFVPEGERIATIELASGNKEVYNSTGPGELSKYPIVILVDGGSASASEILAGTLQDQGIAKLVGTQTFGKGSVQQIVSYLDGSQLKISVANWFTSGGRNINKVGLEPDIEVEDNGNPDEDIQLRRAIEVIKSWQ